MEKELKEKIFLRIKKNNIAINRNDILPKLETILEDRKMLKMSIDEVVKIFFDNKSPGRFYEDWCYLLEKDSVSDDEIYLFLGTYSILDAVYSHYVYKLNLRKEE